MNIKRTIHNALNNPKKREKNPVAKFAGEFNKSQVHRDRTKYCRKDKYRKLGD